MRPYALTETRGLPILDKRIWPMVMAIGFFAWLVMKEVSLPSSVIAAFGGIALLGLFMMGVQSPEVPLYLLVAYLPFSRILVGDFGTQAYALNLTNILMGWVLVGYLARGLWKREHELKATLLNKFVWLFCLLGSVALIRAGWEYGSWYVWEFVTPLKRWLTPVFLYFLTLWVVRDKRILKTLVVLVMVAVAVVAFMAVRDYGDIANSSFDKSRVGGIADQPNTLGAFFVYYMFLFLGFFLTYSRKVKAWWLLVPFALCFRGIMVTFSRGAYLGFAAGVLTTCFFRSKLLFIAAVAGLGIAVANPILLPAGVRYRMGMTVEAKRSSLEFPPDDITETLESSAATRVEIWRGALQMIRDHPWWGVGYGAFPQFIPRYTQGRIGRMDAHNSYLLIAAEMGIPTLLVFLLTLVMVIFYAHRLYRRTADPTMKAIALGVLGGLGGLLVTNMFGSRMDDQAVASYFWILCALVMRGVLMERRKPA